MSATITTADWADYQYMRFLDDTGAEDFRYEITANPEPDDPASMYFVARFDWRTGAEIEAFTTDDPYRDVEAARLSQRHPYGGPDHDERLHMDADELLNIYGRLS